jgi:hypothetical protein
MESKIKFFNTLISRTRSHIYNYLTFSQKMLSTCTQKKIRKQILDQIQIQKKIGIMKIIDFLQTLDIQSNDLDFNNLAETIYYIKHFLNSIGIGTELTNTYVLYDRIPNIINVYGLKLTFLPQYKTSHNQLLVLNNYNSLINLSHTLQWNYICVNNDIQKLYLLNLLNEYKRKFLFRPIIVQGVFVLGILSKPFQRFR